MTPDEANELIYDLIEAVRLRENDQGRFIQHHNEVNRISNLIARAMYGKEFLDEDPSGQRREPMSPDPLDDEAPF